MKYILGLSILLVALSMPSPARADAWADFDAFNQKFYMIDKMETGPISCRVRNSKIDEIMEKIPSVADFIANQVDRFRVTVRPDGNILFVTPRTNIPFGTYDSVEGLTKILADIVGKTEKDVSDLLKGAMSTKRDEIRNLSEMNKDGKTVFSFEALDMDGNWAKLEVTPSDGMDTVRETRDTGIFVGEDKYTKTDGKFFLASQHTHSNQTEGVRDVTLQVKYQQIGKVWFPSRLIADVHIGPKLNPAHGEIDLTDCTSP